MYFKFIRTSTKTKFLFANDLHKDMKTIFHEAAYESMKKNGMENGKKNENLVTKENNV